MFTKIMLLVIFLLSTAGVCEMIPRSDPIVLSDLYGVYNSTSEYGLLNQLKIYKDSTYIRLLLTADSIKTIDTGKWEVEFYMDDQRHVELTLSGIKSRYEYDFYNRHDSLNMFGPESRAKNYHKASFLVYKDIGSKYIKMQLGSRYNYSWVKKEKNKKTNNK